MKTIIKDQNSGMALLECELPDTYESKGQLQLRQYTDNQAVYLETRSVKGNSTIGFNTGENYVYEKQKMQMFFSSPVQQGAQNGSGAWYASPTALTADLDGIASSLLNKQVKASTYYDLPKTMADKAGEFMQKELNNTIEEFQAVQSISPVPVGMIITNYLFDGGMGIYEDGDKIAAVCLYRIGFETDITQMPGISENKSGAPFGQAPLNPGAVASQAFWSVPHYMWLLSDQKEDLRDFMNFAATADYSKEVKDYSEQLRMQVRQYQYQKAQMETMQNQAMINTAFAQQQQQFASMDRMRDFISRDLDSFRSNLNSTMAQNDMRFTNNLSSGESLDDRIQRWRHESMMGVDTYERNDGSTVEYSNYADRVFENNLDSTQHFGTHHYYDDYVPEGWHEMKKK